MVTIDTGKCLACGGCIDICPATAIRMIDDIVSINTDRCAECSICIQVCPVNAPYLLTA